MTFDSLKVRQDWVDTVWDGQFTETLELPADYEEIIQGVELDKLLTRLTELISRWIKTHKNGAEEVEDSADMNSTSQSVDLYRSLFHQSQSTKLKSKFLAPAGAQENSIFVRLSMKVCVELLTCILEQSGSVCCPSQVCRSLKYFVLYHIIPLMENI